MSIERRSEEAEVFDRLAGYARSHFGEGGFLGKILTVGEYDPTREIHDFHNTFFEARPKFYTPALLTVLASAITKRPPRGPHSLHELIVEPFKPQAEEIAESYSGGKLMVLTGHQNVIEPGLVMLGIQRTIMEQTGKSYSEIAQDTHLMAAMAILVVDILGRWSLAGLARQLTNVHGTYPATPKYRNDPDGISRSFQHDSNQRMLTKYAEVTDGARGVVGVAAVPATNEYWDKAIGRNVVPRVTGDAERGTIGLLMQDWDILTVGGTYRHGYSVEPDKIIPAKDVTPELIHGLVESVIVASRNRNGLPSVYAAA